MRRCGHFPLALRLVPGYEPRLTTRTQVGDGASGGLKPCRAGRYSGVSSMQFRPLLRPILDDEGLTRHLGDQEARVLVEWLVERAERAGESADEATATTVVAGHCRRAKAIGLFVALWCYRDDRGAAGQLAVAERFTWPLPHADVDPCPLRRPPPRDRSRMTAGVEPFPIVASRSPIPIFPATSTASVPCVGAGRIAIVTRLGLTAPP